MAHHILKAQPDSFNLLRLRTSEVQLRKNDRDFQVGDICEFLEWDPVREFYTGHTIRPVPIVIVLKDHEGLAPGWCLIVLDIPTTDICKWRTDLVGKTEVENPS